MFNWWKDLKKRDQAFNAAVEADRAKIKAAISELSESERAEYEAQMQAETEKAEAKIDGAIQTVFAVLKVLGVLGILGIMLTNPWAIFGLLPFFIALWGIQLITRK